MREQKYKTKKFCQSDGNMSSVPFAANLRNISVANKLSLLSGRYIAKDIAARCEFEPDPVFSLICELD